MRRYVKDFVAACPECCLNKTKGGKAEGQLHVSEVLPIPFRTIHLDHLGPFPRSKKGNLYILVIVCAFSKYTVLKALKSTKSTLVVNVLKDFMSTYGQPLMVVTDRGTAFTAKDFETFMSSHGVQHVKVAVRTPRANGQAERLNRSVLSALRCITASGNDWESKLPDVQWGLNSQINSTTKFSPNDLIFNYNPRDYTTNRLIQAVEDEVLEENRSTNDFKILAAENTKRAKDDWKRRYDAKHRRPTQYKLNDLVALEHIPTASGTSHKLEPKYRGPYIITRVLDLDRYVVEDLPDAQNTQKRYVGVLSSDHLKPWCCLGPEEGEDEEEAADSNVNQSPQDVDGSGEAEL